MAAWQVEFHVVPKRALAAAPAPLTADALRATPWWAAATLPAGYREWLDATAIPDRLPPPGLEAWGDAEGNRVEVSSAAGRVTGVRVLVDVRRLDAKFAAGLLTFVRAADAALVRADGLVVEPTAGGFGLALRGSAAWRAVQSPAALIDPARVGRPADE